LIGPLGLPEHSSKEARQRVLVRRCYLNPQANRRFRPSFNLAGFEVVDCQDDFVRNALGFDDELEAKPAPPPETPQAEGTDASSWGGWWVQVLSGIQGVCPAGDLLGERYRPEFEAASRRK